MDVNNGAVEEGAQMGGIKVALCGDVKGYMVRGTIYGKYGEYVTVIGDHGNVLTVSGRSGRFPVPRDQVRKISPDELHRVDKSVLATK